MTEAVTYAMVAQAAEFIRARIRRCPRVGLVLGSGLQLLAARVQDAAIIPYAEIPAFPRATVAGHSGYLVIGALGGVAVVVMQGRFHLYEGYSAAQVTLPIRVMRHLGVETLIVTNAAGGINPAFRVGDLMAIVDHINLVGIAGHHPLRGPNDERFGPRFPDMSRAYDPALLELLRAEAHQQGIPLREGVYAMVAGPSFETPAEIRFLRAIGADAVGMSTVPEVIVGRHGGMRVMGLSLISNIAVDTLGDREKGASHEEVLEVGQQIVPRQGALLEGFLRRLG